MNLLITGANGQLGKDCQAVFAGTPAMTCVDIEELDITREDDVRALVANIQPAVIINAAAYTQVDRCETEQEAAWAVNVTGAGNLAQSARDCGALLVHISTDYVFDGEKTCPDTYEETEPTAPLSYYGRTKLESERAIMNATDNHLILRTAWLYGFHGHNFIKTILKKVLADPDKELKIVDDQVGSPTWSMALARQIAGLIEPPARGLYHASAEGACTWYEFARYFLKKLDVPHRISPCATADYPTPAVRPRCAVLENRRLKEEKRNRMDTWQSALDEYLQQYGEALLAQCRPTD